MLAGLLSFAWEVERVRWLWLCLHLSSLINENTWTMFPGIVYRAMGKGGGLSKLHFLLDVVVLVIGLAGAFNILLFTSKPTLICWFCSFRRLKS